MKVLYMPARLVARLLGGIAGRKLYAGVWARISDTPRPPTSAADQRLWQVATGAALKGAIAAGTIAIADQLAARLFHHLLGAWPAHARKRAQSDAKLAQN